MQVLIMQEVHQILQKVCFRCKKNTWYIESNHIFQPPKYLIIIINRFSHYFVSGRHENMSPRTAGRVTMCEMLHESEPSLTRASESHRHIQPPTVMSNVLITRSWPAFQKRIGTSRAVQHIEHTSESVEQFSTGLHFVIIWSNNIQKGSTLVHIAK